MNKLFLDTGFIIALESIDDQFHNIALMQWQKVLSNPPLTLITTTYILDETFTYFNNCNHHNKAIEIGERLMSSPSVQIIQVDKTLFENGWQYFKKHKDKTYSFTDCISFIVMKNMAIRQAMTFDKHFVQAGFHKILSD